MRWVLAAALVAVAVVPAAAQQDVSANVNERYTVESVEISGADQSRLDSALRQEIESVVGERFNQGRLNELAVLLRRALPGRTVSVRLSRGSRTDQIRVIFEIRRYTAPFDIRAVRAGYNSRIGWSGELTGSFRVSSSTFAFGVLSDGDSLIERFAGVRARYGINRIGTERVRLAFEFASLHQIWNDATGASSAGGRDLYRTRQNFQPVASIVIARPLVLGLGVSFERMQFQFPAARTKSSNAVLTTLRYARQLEESGSNEQRLDAGYSLRAATRTLASDFVYARHAWDARYELRRGPNRLETSFASGMITGSAPLYERFVLGNSTTLRGWSKYDIAPLGAGRLAYGSVEYRYRALEIFYDTGAVWDRGRQAVARHSAGAGIRVGDFAFLVGFPIRSGHAEPVFIAGLNL